MILVNLYGAPGAGKSTGAAYIFSQLKMAGINCELVTEFAKDKVWEENKAVFDNQAYIFGKQYFKISRCADKVDVIVTDSPLLLSLIYNDNPILGEEFNALVRRVAGSYDSLNFYLTRKKDYNPIGRHQTEEESDQKGVEIKEMLDKERIDYITYPGCDTGYECIVIDVLRKLKEQGKL
jgi:hypothetical protein